MPGIAPHAPTMRALRFARFGPPEVLEVVDVPRPAADGASALVRVDVAGMFEAGASHRGWRWRCR